jgi:hypothetical protein
MDKLKEYVCTYAMPKGAENEPRFIALYQEYARAIAETEGIIQIENDYRIVHDPFDVDACPIIYCIVRGR